MAKLPETASQTAGPYVHIGCAPSTQEIGVYQRDLGAQMITGEVAGDRITLEGVIFDGEGAPVTDAMVEIWQADAKGLYASPAERRGGADPGFTGWGRAMADPKTGRFAFDTVKPGSRDGQAPHVTLWIAARGINLALQTRAYFEDEPANADDPLLIAAGDRASTMIARRTNAGYRIEIRLQGANETVFLDI